MGSKALTAAMPQPKDPSPTVLRDLATEVMRGNIDITELSQFIATVMPRCLHSGKLREIFPVWERHGFHVMPVHFYQPYSGRAKLAAKALGPPK